MDVPGVRFPGSVIHAWRLLGKAKPICFDGQSAGCSGEGARDRGAAEWFPRNLPPHAGGRWFRSLRVLRGTGAAPAMRVQRDRSGRSHDNGRYDGIGDLVRRLADAGRHATELVFHGPAPDDASLEPADMVMDHGLGYRDRRRACSGSTRPSRRTTTPPMPRTPALRCRGAIRPRSSGRACRFPVPGRDAKHAADPFARDSALPHDPRQTPIG